MKVESCYNNNGRENNSNITRLHGKIIISLTFAFKNEFKFPLPGLQIRIECKQPQQTCHAL